MRRLATSDEAEALASLFASPPLPAAHLDTGAARAPAMPPAAARICVTIGVSMLAGFAIGPILAGVQALGPTASLIAGSAMLSLIAVVAARAARTGLAPLRASATAMAVGAGQGLAGMTWCALVLAVAGRLLPRESGPGTGLLLGAAALFAQVAAEELFFRGWLQEAVARIAPPIVAVGVAAILFSALHLIGGERSPLTLANIALAGLWLGILARRLGLAAAIAAHWGWNGAEMLGFGLYPNPGVGPWGAMWDRDIAGPALWGGGEEGLNASAIATLVFAGLALLVAALGPNGQRL